MTVFLSCWRCRCSDVFWSVAPLLWWTGIVAGFSPMLLVPGGSPILSRTTCCNPLPQLLLAISEDYSAARTTTSARRRRRRRRSRSSPSRLVLYDQLGGPPPPPQEQQEQEQHEQEEKETPSPSSMTTGLQTVLDNFIGDLKEKVVIDEGGDDAAEENDNSSSSGFFCAIDFDNISAPYMSRMDSDSTFVEFTDDGLCVPAGPLGQFKERLANILREPFVELIIATSVLINSLLVALGTLDYLDPYMHWIRSAELFVSIVFCLDFFGRWVSSSKEYGRHVLKPQFALDVVVVILPLMVGLTSPSFWSQTPLPSGLTSPSGLVNLELLRVLRLRRVLRDLNTFERFAERALLGAVSERSVNLVQEWQLQLARVLLSLFTLVSVSSGLVYTAENGVNPAINNYFDALYFGLTALTTVGFGDISPITWQGKLIVCGSILVGVAVVPAQAAALVEALLEREDIRRESRKRASQPKKLQPTMPANSSSINRLANGGPTPPPDDKILALDTGRACPECGASFHWTNAQYCYSCGKELE